MWPLPCGSSHELISMSVAVLSLMVIILVATSSTEIWVPPGSSWSMPERRLLRLAVMVSGCSQRTFPSATALPQHVEHIASRPSRAALVSAVDAVRGLARAVAHVGDERATLGSNQAEATLTSTPVSGTGPAMAGLMLRLPISPGSRR
jgi:hypothetical protein